MDTNEEAWGLVQRKYGGQQRMGLDSSNKPWWECILMYTSMCDSCKGPSVRIGMTISKELIHTIHAHKFTQRNLTSSKQYLKHLNRLTGLSQTSMHVRT